MGKILFHVNSMGKGGAEHVISILSRCFAQDGYDVVVTTLWQADSEYVLDGRVRRVNVGLTQSEETRGRLAKAAIRAFRYRQCIAREKPDIVISFCSKANFRSAYSMTGMRIPLLVSVRNDPQKDYAPYPAKCRYMSRKAAGCVFQTPDAQRFFDERLQRKSRVIWNPLEEKYFVQAARGARRDSTIVTVGRITEQKNQLLLLKAFLRISSDFPQYRLLIYGEDSGDGTKERLEAFCAGNHLEGRVVFMGTSSALEKDIANAGVFVLPSDYEGMPNALIEAMALGIPCIATDCPCGGPAMLMKQFAGILVPPGKEAELADAMRRVLSDPPSADEMGDQARSVRKWVHPQHIYDQWKAYVESLIGGEVGNQL